MASREELVSDAVRRVETHVGRRHTRGALRYLCADENNERSCHDRVDNVEEHGPTRVFAARISERCVVYRALTHEVYSQE